MKFQRYPRYPFRRTRRKDLAAERKLRLEREALPLLGELIREGQPSVDAIMAERERRWIEAEKEDRAYRARHWREARQRLAALPPEVRKVVIERWNRGIYPATAVYLLCLIEKVTREIR